MCVSYSAAGFSDGTAGRRCCRTLSEGAIFVHQRAAFFRRQLAQGLAPLFGRHAPQLPQSSQRARIFAQRLHDVLAGQRLAVFDLAYHFRAPCGDTLVGKLLAPGLRFLDALAESRFFFRRRHREPCGTAVLNCFVDALVDILAPGGIAARAHFIDPAEGFAEFLGRIDRADDLDPCEARRFASGGRCCGDHWRGCCGAGGRFAGNAGPDLFSRGDRNSKLLEQACRRRCRGERAEAGDADGDPSPQPPAAPTRPLAQIRQWRRTHLGGGEYPVGKPGREALYGIIVQHPGQRAAGDDGSALILFTHAHGASPCAVHACRKAARARCSRLSNALMFISIASAASALGNSS